MKLVLFAGHTFARKIGDRDETENLCSWDSGVRGVECGTLRAAAVEEKPVIALFGATARSGREIIRQGLERGYTIKGFARTPSKLGIEHENLTLYKGDIYDRASIAAVLEGDEVVLSMIGRGTPSDPLAEVGPVDIYTVMGENLIRAMQEKGNTRLIMASSTGVEHRADVDSAKPPTWRHVEHVAVETHAIFTTTCMRWKR